MMKHLLIPLCLFVCICSICGVGYAAAQDDLEPVPTKDPWLESFENWENLPSDFISDPPVISVPPVEPSEAVEPTPEPTPDPTPDPTPIVTLRPSETVYDPDDWDLPGGDVPAIDPSDFGSGNTYITLPDDFVIQSASGLNDEYAIDPQVLAPVTPGNTSGLKSVLLSILGNYDPIVAQYQYANSNGTYQYIREIQPDYVWLVSAGIFAILLYCTWRLLGGLVCKQ